MIVGASVGTKDQRFRGAAFFIRHLECASDKLGAVDFSDSIAYHHPRKQVKDHADVVILVVGTEARHVAYPHFVGTCDGKLLI